MSSDPLIRGLRTPEITDQRIAGTCPARRHAETRAIASHLTNGIRGIGNRSKIFDFAEWF
jgi:hypothetical protein